LYSAYGEALTREATGVVTPDAEKAFQSALVLNPRDPAARYYLGLAYSARGQADKALPLWEGLLAEMPPSPLRSELVDRVAALKARAGGEPPTLRRWLRVWPRVFRRIPTTRKAGSVWCGHTRFLATLKKQKPRSPMHAKPWRKIRRRWRRSMKRPRHASSGLEKPVHLTYLTFVLLGPRRCPLPN